ncbi:hypothetical protein [Campylobacter sp. JMF_08 NE1]|uniref:hypothetical protein n=1 Tax=Campylobacter sp. JMF_08 NE1 TaxID=2983821 RepID=UPI0022E9EEA9|nr:hypothetical protein [Campylobacter sp. JMF_08 NE1]MDA3047763.1 hypothetical protein [Campylobacter sp. JMF_08 NE1]
MRAIFALLIAVFCLAHDDENISLKDLNFTISDDENSSTQILFEGEDFIQKSLDEGYTLWDPDSEKGEVYNLVANAMSATIENSQNSGFKVGVLMAQNILGSRADSIANALLAFVSERNLQANLRFYYIGNESEEGIIAALEAMERDNVALIIAPLNRSGVDIVDENSQYSSMVFVPTLNQNLSGFVSNNIYFGGIDYSEQMQYLLGRFAENLYAIGDESALSQVLNDMAFDSRNIEEFYTIKSNRNAVFDFEGELPQNANFILNLPSSKILSVIGEISHKKLNTQNLLATQVGFDGEIIGALPSAIGGKFYLANSISPVSNSLLHRALSLGVDLRYEWIAYSALSGFDYFYSNFALNRYERAFSEEFYDNGLRFDTKIYEVGEGKFQKLN